MSQEKKTDYYSDHNFLPLQKEISEKEKLAFKVINDAIKNLYEQELQKFNDIRKVFTYSVGEQDKPKEIPEEILKELLSNEKLLNLLKKEWFVKEQIYAELKGFSEEEAERFVNNAKIASEVIQGNPDLNNSLIKTFEERKNFIDVNIEEGEKEGSYVFRMDVRLPLQEIKPDGIFVKTLEHVMLGLFNQAEHQFMESFYNQLGTQYNKSEEKNHFKITVDLDDFEEKTKQELLSSMQRIIEKSIFSGREEGRGEAKVSTKKDNKQLGRRDDGPTFKVVDQMVFVFQDVNNKDIQPNGSIFKYGLAQQKLQEKLEQEKLQEQEKNSPVMGHMRRGSFSEGLAVRELS